MNTLTESPKLYNKRIAVASLMFLLVTAFFMMFTPSPAYAGVEDFTFNQVSTKAELSKNSEDQSVLNVEETYVANFATPNQNKGIVRALPKTWNGGKYDMNLRIEGVYDESNQPVYYDIENENGDAVLLIDDDTYKEGLHTYVVKWSATGVTGYFEQSKTEEFYWNLISGDRPQPTDAAQVTLTIAPDLVSSLTGDNACYQGALRSDTQCTLNITDNVISTETTPLEGNGGITLAVGFEPGTFAEPAASFGSKVPVIGGILLGSMLATFGLGTAFATKRRKKAIRELNISKRPVIAQYTAPEGWSAVQGGTFLAKTGYVKTSREKNLASSVLEIALQGGLSISKDGGDVSLQRQKATVANPVLKAITDIIFSKSRVVEGKKLEPLNQTDAFFYDEKALFQPVKAGMPLWPWLILVLGGVGAYLYAPNLAVILLTGVAAFILLMLSFFITHWARRPVPNQVGEDLANYMLGLKKYIEVAEEDRIQMLQSVEGAESKTINDAEIIYIYEQLLPWAIIFGLEKSWQKVIEFRIEQLPETQRQSYYSSYNYYYASQVSNLVGATRQAVKAYDAAQARTSGSGGSTGGGFSGGGGGGGSVGGR
jgi:uncharacterized membrane protein YgcG